MTTDTTTPVPISQAEYWMANGGTWRICRKAFKCNGLGGTLPENQCDHEVERGERYLDTGEVTRPPFGTQRMCAWCGNKRAKATP